MIDAQKLLGVDVMTGHWEFTYGAERVKQASSRSFAGKVEFVAQNVKTADFGDPVFKPYRLREINGVAGRHHRPGVPLHADRQSAPLRAGLDLRHPGGAPAEGRRRGARARARRPSSCSRTTAWTSTSSSPPRARHRRDPRRPHARRRARAGDVKNKDARHQRRLERQVPRRARPRRARQAASRTTATGCCRCSRTCCPPTRRWRLIRKARAFEAKLDEKLAVTEGLLYRRGNFNGTFDQLILRALLPSRAPRSRSRPGFRWGTTLLPGDAITFEHVMDQTAITYPYSTLNELTGEQIKAILEDVADNLFNPDPYLQQGGDMVRVAGLTGYACEPGAKIGSRISDMKIGNRKSSLEPTRSPAGPRCRRRERRADLGWGGACSRRISARRARRGARAGPECSVGEPWHRLAGAAPPLRHRHRAPRGAREKLLLDGAQGGAHGAGRRGDTMFFLPSRRAARRAPHDLSQGGPRVLRAPRHRRRAAHHRRRRPLSRRRPGVLGAGAGAHAAAWRSGVDRGAHLRRGQRPGCAGSGSAPSSGRATTSRWVHASSAARAA